MPVIFEYYKNAESRRVIATGGDGRVLQLPVTGNDPRQHWVRDQTTGGAVRLINRRSARVLDVIGGNLFSGAQLQQYLPHGGANQRWKFGAASGFPDEWHIHADVTDLVIDVPYGSPDPGVLLQIFQKHGGANQRYEIEQVFVEDVVTLHPVTNNDLALSVAGHLHFTGTSVLQEPIDGGWNQMWQVIARGPSEVQLAAVHSTKVLDYPLYGAQNNIPGLLSTYRDNSGNNQRWEIQKVGVQGPNDVVVIKSAANGFVLDVPFGSGASGTHIQTYPAHGGDNQKWIMKTV